jgi:hypothetical protein
MRVIAVMIDNPLPGKQEQAAMPLDLTGGNVRSKFGGISKFAIRRARAIESTKRWKTEHPDYEREWFKRHPGYKSAWRRRARRNPDYCARELIWMARARAGKTGLEFRITVRDLMPMPETCPVLGTPINYTTPRGQGSLQENDRPTVDRIDNSKGYVPGNVAVISWRANRLKSDGSLEEMEKLVAYMRQHRV